MGDHSLVKPSKFTELS